MLKEQIKNFAYEIGADLVGFGNVERSKNAPLMMSPQGLFPKCHTIIVMAIHHPDACIELGGERHPQEIGPYSIQYLMNARLDELSYRMAVKIEKMGFNAIPIAASNIWRYNQYKDLKAIFAPDVSHIYMAVVAGLADMGFNGLALTPEYGARNRFVTVLTDAVIEPDPLIPPGSLCDKCMLCRKNCPTKALEKEIDGENILKIDNYEYKFPKKNLWRCAWGEHFDLDLDLNIPEKVNESVILDTVRTHGLRAGEMGQCLKFCVPKKIRSFDKTYSRTPMRKLAVSLDESIESRKLADRIIASAYARGAEHVFIHTAEDLKAAGISIDTELQGAQSAVTLLINRAPDSDNKWQAECRTSFEFGARQLIDSACYDVTRELEELGFRSVMNIEKSGSHYAETGIKSTAYRILQTVPGIDISRVMANTVITRKKLSPRVTRPGSVTPPALKQTDLTDIIRNGALSYGADLCGVASVERIENISSQIRGFFEGQETLTATDKAKPFSSWVPEIKREKRDLAACNDYLPGAKSVIVIALRFTREVLEQATKPPAEAVGPYAFETYATNWIGKMVGVRIIKLLEQYGHKGMLVSDLMRTESFVANPRSWQEDLLSNRFAAVAAGMGALTDNGRVATPQFGIRQRFIAIVTDAELMPSPLLSTSDSTMCSKCEKYCVQACPTKAFSNNYIEFTCEGSKFRFLETDPIRCDWSKRYTLVPESGFGYLGSIVNEKPSANPSEAELDKALRKIDPIKKYRPVVAEPCVLKCPYALENLTLDK
ncbi:MAG: hypothetical protein A2283_13110 [Lentisphaerae bacterium RIFOXYA12_FULL_48_11]|nr:MAG: hypothetical protein A2283_13110 [Lentisphaerae bacterium RIFOXYA12_FULL_48_11]